MNFSFSKKNLIDDSIQTDIKNHICIYTHTLYVQHMHVYYCTAVDISDLHVFLHKGILG